MERRLIEEKDPDKLADLYCEVYKMMDVGEEWTHESAYNLLFYWLKRQPDLCYLMEKDGKMLRRH